MKITDTLMSPPMARAWAEGLKTRTRRVINRLRGFGPITEFGPSDTRGYDWQFRDKRLLWNEIRNRRLFDVCPYGVPGDRLRLLTTWAVWSLYDNVKPCDLRQYMEVCRSSIWTYFDSDTKPDWCGKLRPGRFMPKWMRELMPQPKILGIEPGRLQDISEDEAREEGIREVTKDGQVKKYCVYDLGDHSSTPWQDMPRTAVDAFRGLWDSLNAKRGYPWDANDWVWDIEFEGSEVRHATD